MTATYRTASASEVALMLDWAADEGWNPGLDDAAAFFAADPDGFFVAEVDGTPVAAISVVNHDDTMAFLGLYLCRPSHRGRGIGFGLWQHALAHAGNRTVGLDGVAAQQANYARSGFAPAGATRRFMGQLPTGPTVEHRPATPADLPALAALDRAACGYERPAFLSNWMMGSASRRTVVSETGGALDGAATARACREGVKIGPVIAANAERALSLAASAAAALPGDAPQFIDVAPGQDALAERLTSLGFQETFATARMYRSAPPQPDGTLQAVATMELG